MEGNLCVLSLRVDGPRYWINSPHTHTHICHTGCLEEHKLISTKTDTLKTSKVTTKYGVLGIGQNISHFTVVRECLTEGAQFSVLGVFRCCCCLFQKQHYNIQLCIYLNLNSAGTENSSKAYLTFNLTFSFRPSKSIF